MYIHRDVDLGSAVSSRLPRTPSTYTGPRRSVAESASPRQSSPLRLPWRRGAPWEWFPSPLCNRRRLTRRPTSVATPRLSTASTRKARSATSSLPATSTVRRTTRSKTACTSSTRWTRSSRITTPTRTRTPSRLEVARSECSANRDVSPLRNPFAVRSTRVINDAGRYGNRSLPKPSSVPNKPSAPPFAGPRDFPAPRHKQPSADCSYGEQPRRLLRLRRTVAEAAAEADDSAAAIGSSSRCRRQRRRADAAKVENILRLTRSPPLVNPPPLSSLPASSRCNFAYPPLRVPPTFTTAAYFSMPRYGIAITYLIYVLYLYYII